MSEIKISDIVSKIGECIEECGTFFVIVILPMIIASFTIIYSLFVDVKLNDETLFNAIHLISFYWGCLIWIIAIIGCIYYIILKIYDKHIKNIVLFKGKPEPKIDNIAILQIRDEFGIEI